VRSKSGVYSIVDFRQNKKPQYKYRLENSQKRQRLPLAFLRVFKAIFILRFFILAEIDYAVYATAKLSKK